MRAHERLMTTMNNYEIDVDELYPAGAIEKKKIRGALRSPIFLMVTSNQPHPTHLARAFLSGFGIYVGRND